MRPVVTVAEMRALDAAALEITTHDELVERAGRAVAEAVLDRCPSVADRTIIVVAGKGSNGADGRVAARLLEVKGASVKVLDATGPVDLGGADVVIDAAYGTGLARDYDAPTAPPGVLVVAVDIPSGVDGDTGLVHGSALAADVTVTMAALTPGLLLGQGPALSGDVVLADIGISTATASMALLDEDDLSLIPARAHRSHKWSRAVTIVAGGPGMEGAGALSALGCLRGGAGMTRLVHPVDGTASMAWPLELVRLATSPDQLAAVALEEAARCGALLIGPGLGTGAPIKAAVHKLIAERPCPVVLDADGLTAFSTPAELAAAVADGPPVILTPHDGELTRLLGIGSLGDDRVEVVRSTATATGAVVLLKGPTTIIASPEGTVLFSMAGTPALATAGTGDVLAGLIAALLAAGLAAPLAAGLGALAHGCAGARATGTLIASELPELIGNLIGALHHGG